MSRPRVVAVSPDDGSMIDLRDPAKAALLSWLVPGLGQLWQGRRLKGWLFLIAIVGTLLAGLWIGGGRVTYFQWKPGARRLEFLGQAGIGSVAIPALVQSWSFSVRGQPLFPGWCAPPVVHGVQVAPAYGERLEQAETGLRFERGPRRWTLSDKTVHNEETRADQLSAWYLRLGRYFDVGTLYATIAGLLNMLVIYDAWAGPLRDAESEAGGNAGADAPRSRRRKERGR